MTTDGPLQKPLFYFGGALSGGTTFITNTVGFSLGPNGPGTLCLSGGRLLRNANCIVPGEFSKGTPRHDRGKYAAIRSHARLQGGHDLLARPSAETGFLIRRQVWPDKHTKARNFKTNI